MLSLRRSTYGVSYVVSSSSSSVQLMTPILVPIRLPVDTLNFMGILLMMGRFLEGTGRTWIRNADSNTGFTTDSTTSVHLWNINIVGVTRNTIWNIVLVNRPTLHESTQLQYRSFVEETFLLCINNKDWTEFENSDDVDIK